MSSVYVLEPPTKGKVLLKTSGGPLDFELWPKEAPKAVRNFVQLCLDGYYDGTIFHRIIKTFMVQGGDPTGTGKGGDTIYGEPFADEVHSRLRFNHRGLVACANAGSPNSNNSQFFMTLDRCDWLDKKHTIFAKVTGDTIYNLIKLGDVPTGPDDRPEDPPRIISVEVLWNPFDDIFPRRLANSVQVPKDDSTTKKGKKATKELNLLSFGEEVEEEEQELATVKEKKIRSSHDVLQDPRLLKSLTDAAKMDPIEAKRRKDVQTSVRQALGGSVEVADTTEQRNSRSRFPQSEEDDEVTFDMKMRKQILDKRQVHAGATKPAGGDMKQGKLSTIRSKTTPPPSMSGRPKSEDEEVVLKKERLNIKKKGLGSEARAEHAATADLDMQLLSPLEQQRLKYKQRRRNLQGREENTLTKLDQFKKKLRETKDVTSSPPGGTTDEDSGDADWLAHNLKFVVDPSKPDDMRKNEDPNQYVVQDPLLQKGKDKFNKMQAKLKRRNREWAGNSVT